MQVVLEQKDFDVIVNALSTASILIIRGNPHEARDWQKDYFRPAISACDNVKRVEECK